MRIRKETKNKDKTIKVKIYISESPLAKINRIYSKIKEEFNLDETITEIMNEIQEVIGGLEFPFF